MRRMLLDTPSLTYRAFHALPDSITDEEGPVNAVRGVLDMQARLLADHAPDELIAVFDADWRPPPRVAACPSYKAERPPEPEAITRQFALLTRVLDALGLARAEAPGWEADDAIAALAFRADPADEVLVVSGDRDLLQLVRDGGATTPAVRLLYTRRGVSDLAVFDAAGVRDGHGVDPERYADYATLRGDPSDGLPGLEGVGEKTARRLLAEHGNVEGVIAHADELSPALAERLRDGAETLRATRWVIALRGDVDVEVVRAEPDPERAAALAREHNLDGPVGRLAEALGREVAT
jgi:5'-3' exonuclease